MTTKNIIKIIRPPIQHSPKSYDALIIIPITPLYFSISSKDMLKKYLTKLLSAPKKVLKKLEKESLTYFITPNSIGYEIKRSFNLLSNVTTEIRISDFEICNIDDEKDSSDNLLVKKYIDNYLEKIKTLNPKSKFTHIIFEYSIIEAEGYSNTDALIKKNFM